MKLSQLLAVRSDLIRKVSLANDAFAYATLRQIAERIERAGLVGPVRLLGVDPLLCRYVPQLIALTENQSVLEEHFEESDIINCSDALIYMAEDERKDFHFRLETMWAQLSTGLEASLREAGVQIDGPMVCE